MKSRFYLFCLVVLILVLTPTVNASNDTNEGFKVRRSGFKTIEKEAEEKPDNTLVEMRNFIDVSKSNGNSTGGNVTGVQPKKKKTNEDGSDIKSKKSNLNASLDGYDEKAYTPVKRDKFPSGHTEKGTQEEINELIKYALSKVGNNYYYEGNNVDYPYDPLTYSPGHTRADGVDGADCSGFVKKCYEHIGVIFAQRNSGAYCDLGKKVVQKDMKPGDIIMFTGSRSKNGSVVHTAIYMGNEKVIQSSGDVKVPGQIKESKLNGTPGDYYIGGGGYAQAVHTVVRLLEVD